MRNLGDRGLGHVNIRCDNRVLRLRNRNLLGDVYSLDGSGGDCLLFLNDGVLGSREWNFGGECSWLVGDNQGR